MTSIHFMQTREKSSSYAFQSRINKLVFSKILRKGFKLLSKDGQFAVSRATITLPNFIDFKEQIGGEEGFILLFGCHYKRLFSNPRMSVLFDTSSPDTNVSAYEHGKRLGSLLISRWTEDFEFYDRLERGDQFQNTRKIIKKQKNVHFVLPSIRTRTLLRAKEMHGLAMFGLHVMR